MTIIFPYYFPTCHVLGDANMSNRFVHKNMALTPSHVRTNAYFVKQRKRKYTQSLFLFLFFEEHLRNSVDRDTMLHEK
jgi:hypothetical protein